MPNYILRISPSMLGRLACDTRAALASLGYTGPDPSVPAEVGKVMHASFARMLRNDPNDPPLAYMDPISEWEDSELYNKLLADDKLGEDFTFQNLSRIGCEWNRRHLIDSSLPFKLEAIEEPFDEHLFYINSDQLGIVDVRIHGIMDGYGVDEQGFTYILEHKFTRKRLDDTFKDGFKMDAQNGAYIWAAAQKLGRPVMGSYVNGVSMKKLPDSDRKCRTHSLPYEECGHLHLSEMLFLVDRSSDDLADWKNEAMAAARDYLWLLTRIGQFEGIGGKPMDVLTSARMQGQFIRDYCQWCDFWDFCRAHRPVADIEHWLRKQEDTDDGSRTNSRLKSGLSTQAE